MPNSQTQFTYKEYIDHLIDESSQSTIRANIYKENHAPSKLYKYMRIPDCQCEKEKRFYQILNEEFWFPKRSILNDPFEFIIPRIAADDDSYSLNQKYYEQVYPQIEIFSLTTSQYNKLMWSHYTDAHKGLCIEFTVDDPMKVWPVEYTDIRPDFSELYSRFMQYKDDIVSGKSTYEQEKYGYALSALYCFKGEEWRYENEFRLIERQDPDDKTDNGHLYSIRKYGLSVSKIICGWRCSEENQKLIMRILQGQAARECMKKIDISRMTIQNDLSLKEEILTTEVHHA